MNKLLADSTKNFSLEDFEAPEEALDIEIDWDVYRKDNTFGSGGDPSFQ